MRSRNFCVLAMAVLAVCAVSNATFATVVFDDDFTGSSLNADNWAFGGTDGSLPSSYYAYNANIVVDNRDGGTLVGAIPSQVNFSSHDIALVSKPTFAYGTFDFTLGTGDWGWVNHGFGLTGPSGYGVLVRQDIDSNWGFYTYNGSDSISSGGDLPVGFTGGDVLTINWQPGSASLSINHGEPVSTLTTNVPSSLTPLNFNMFVYFGSGMSMDRITASTVPEPSTVILLATGLAGLLAYAWRKRR